MLTSINLPANAKNMKNVKNMKNMKNRLFDSTVDWICRLGYRPQIVSASEAANSGRLLIRVSNES